MVYFFPIIADFLADKSDNKEGNVKTEAILSRCLASRCLAQIKERFGFDKDDDYLRLAQLLDPSVSYRVS